MGNLNDQRDSSQDDEISLVDLARVLVRRRVWIFATFSVCVLMALAYALLQERQYNFTTSILIGEFGLDKTIAEARSTKNVLERRIAPLVERSFVDERKIENMPFATSVIADEGNNFVTLQSKASKEQQPLVVVLHSEMASALTRDHNEKLSLLERESDIRLGNLSAALATEKQQMARFQKLLSASTQVIRDVGVSDVGIKGDVTARADSTANGMEATLSSSSRSLTFLLSQMQLTEQLSKRQTRITELQGELESEELKRSWIKQTRAPNIATASVSPTGTGKTLIVVLGTLLGGMLSLFAAFFVEFVHRVKGEQLG